MSKRKYNKAWENEKWAEGWLEKNENGVDRDQDAHCKVCRITVRSHFSDLQRHGKSKRHTKKMSSLTIAEIKISAYIGVHSAIRTVDHLVAVVKSLGVGSIIEDLELHRTKCSAIIKNVIAPAMLAELVAAIGNGPYSLIVDESTDVSTTKYMCLCVKYFNATQVKLVTNFLGLFLVEEAKEAQCLYQSVCEYLESIELPKKNMTAIATDGASNLCGRKESLYALLKADIPNLQLLKCSCHSIHLCCCKATEELPSSLEYLLKAVYNWFNQSPLRRAKDKGLFDAINFGVDSIRYRQLIQLSQTRWLAFHDACKRILEQWVELQAHFNIVSLSGKCYGSQTIHTMLHDDSNRLYLVFLKYALGQMQSLDLTFQSDQIDAGSAYDDLCSTFLFFANKILKPSFLADHRDGVNLLNQICDALNDDLAFLPLESVDFGMDLMTELTKTELSSDKVLEIKQHCFRFLRRLLMEMSHRLPANMEILKKFKLLNPLNRRGPEELKFPVVLEALRPFLDPAIDISVYEAQWQKLPFIDWKVHFPNGLPVSLIDFWPIVYALADGAGRFSFRELAEAVLRMLCTPTSNACVERVFSVMNLVKTKIRNKMGMSMLEALLRIKIHFNVTGQCCNTFVPSDQMIKLFSSSNMHAGKDDDLEAVIDENEDIFEIMEQV